MGAKTLLRHLGLSKSWKIHHMQYISLHWNESCQLLPILPLMALFKWKSVGKINSSQFYTYNTTVSNQDRVPALMLSCLGQSNKSFRPLSDDLTTSGRLSSTCKVLSKICIVRGADTALILENYEVKHPLVANFYFIPAPLPSQGCPPCTYRLQKDIPWHKYLKHWKETNVLRPIPVGDSNGVTVMPI